MLLGELLYADDLFLMSETIEGLRNKFLRCKEFTYLGDKVIAGGGCQAAVTARTRCGWVKFRECCELLYGKKFPLRLKGVVYENYVRPAIQYGSEAWCLKENEMGIL